MTPKPWIILCAVCALGMASITTPSVADEEGYEDLDRPMLGVVMTPPSSRDLRSHDREDRTGVVVRRVYDNSAAQDMGLERGDLVTEINGVTIDSMSTLREVIQSYHPGDEVHVSGYRGGEALARDGFLGNWPESIPFRNIDSEAEARYRQMVDRRLERQARHLENLRRQQEELEADIAALQNGGDSNRGSGSDDPQAGSFLDRVARGIAQDRHAMNILMNAPAWQFRYDVLVGEPARQSNDNTFQATPGSLRFTATVRDDVL
ncbi:MAG: PDZ domain-containing protein [Planctomycetota bacterium]|nr:MAG: PDZ domain-containing protein [Planctomycetota bacterium]